MPQDLAALLVAEGAVSKADMDRALARQSQLGGALDTALLELGVIGEAQLLPFLESASGLPVAPPEALSEIDPRSRRVFPAKVAERHRLAPFALDGRELSVVASHPVDAAAIDEIGFMLSLTLVPHVGAEWRVHDLIQRLYGGQLPARLAKLADAALRAPAPEPAPEAVPEAVSQPPEEVAPPRAVAATPTAVSIEEAFFAAGDSGSFAPTPVPAAVPPPPSPSPSPSPAPEAGAHAAAGDGAVEAVAPMERPAPPPAAAEEDETSFADIEPERPRPSGFERDATEPAEPLLAALEQAVDLYDALWADEAKPEPPSPEPAAPGAAPTGEPQAASEAPAVAPAPSMPEAEAEAEEPAEPEAPPGEPDRTAPPRWTIDDARTALAAARHRDEVVLVCLRYARDFFEFSALFAVTRDAVVGHDALGPLEDERARARGTAIYANDPGIVRTVLETGAPYLGPVARDTVGTANVLDGLWRGTPRTVLVYPVLVADRPVAVLYADNGEAPVSARRLGDLLLFLSTVGGSFERIIRARKRRRKRAPAAAPAAPAAPEPVTELPAPEPLPAWMEPPPSAAGEPEAAAPASPPAAPEPPPPEPDAAAEGGPAEPPPPAAVEPEAAPVVAPAAAPSPPVADAPAGSPVDAAIATLLSGAPGVADRVAPIVDLVLDPDPALAAAARDALVSHRREAAVKPVPERLRRAVLSGVGERPVLAARALGALRDVESIPILIQALEGGAAQEAADALALVTLQHLGPRPQKWLKWWKENRGRTRAEWLFAALTAPEREARASAAAELSVAGEPPVRYSPDLPSAELEAAARAWWVWWSRQGIAL